MTLSFPPFTPMVKRILITLSGTFVLSFLLSLVFPPLPFTDMPMPWFLDPLALNTALEPLRWDPDMPNIAAWQLVTYGLFHADLWHLAFNALGIWMFGADAERMLGSRGFLRYFLVCVVGGGLLFALAGFLSGRPGVVIGASAGVMGLVVAFAVFSPQRKVFLFPIPFPVPAWALAAFYGLLAAFGSVRPGTGAIAHTAHLGGLLAGYLYLKGFIKPGSWTAMFRRRRKPFRVIPGQGRKQHPWDIN